MYSLASVATTLGLRGHPDSRVPNHVAAFLLANWMLAYCYMSPRGTKIWLGIDNNVAPREDLATIGEDAVKAGRISRRTLNKVKREEAANANAIEGYAFFVAAMLTASFAGVPSKQINKIGVWYTLSRVAFSVFYSNTETRRLSYLRSAAWWSGNISCMTGLVMAMKRMN